MQTFCSSIKIPWGVSKGNQISMKSSGIQWDRYFGLLEDSSQSNNSVRLFYEIRNTKLSYNR